MPDSKRNINSDSQFDGVSYKRITKERGDQTQYLQNCYRARWSPKEMKKAGVVAASVTAAALASSSTSARPNHSLDEKESKGNETGLESRREKDEKFAPRFDGLRFIETLVTAHR